MSEKNKWILYKQYHTLSDKKLDDLHLAFEESPDLNELYFMREEFNHILDNNKDVQTAMNEMDKWIYKVKSKKIIAFDTFVKILQRYKKIARKIVILWFVSPQTTTIL